MRKDLSFPDTNRKNVCLNHSLPTNTLNPPLIIYVVVLKLLICRLVYCVWMQLMINEVSISESGH